MTTTYLARIYARHFKGGSFDHKLAPITVFHGDNFVGKTAVAEAIRVGLLGHSPRHGKRPSDTFGFCGAENGAVLMIVGGDCADGRKFEHTWEMKREKVSLDTIGDLQIPAVPSVLLDCREYLGKSGPDRVRYIFSQIDLEAMGFTTELVTARLKSGIKVAAPTEASEKALTDIVEIVEGLGQERDELKQTHQQWIERVIERIKETRDDAEAVVKSMAGTVQGMAQLRAQEGLQGGGNIRATLDAKRKEFQEATLARQRLEDRHRDYESKSKRLADLKKIFAGAKDRSGEVAALEAKHAEQDKILAGYKSRTLELVKRHTELHGEAGALQRQIQDLMDKEKEILAYAKEHLAGDACPTCKSKGKSWKKSLGKHRDDEIAKAEAAIKEFNKQLEGTNILIKAIGGDLEASKARDTEMENLRFAQRQLAKDTQHIKDAALEIKTQTARMEELAKTMGEPVQAGELGDAAAKVGTLQKEVFELEGAERQSVARIQDAKRAEQARQQHEEKTVEVEVAKLALKVMLELQSEMMASAFKGFMTKVNEFGDAIIPGKLEFRDGEIGYYRGATWAGLQFFSGTEELFTFAGLSVALAQEAPLRLVIMDELGRLKAPRRGMLIDRMRDLIRRRVIDQFIGIDVDGEPYGPFNGWENFKLLEVK